MAEFGVGNKGPAAIDAAEEQKLAQAEPNRLLTTMGTFSFRRSLAEAGRGPKTNWFVRKLSSEFHLEPSMSVILVV